MAVNRDVEIDILSRDKTERGVRSAERNFKSLRKNVDENTKSVDKDNKSLEKFGKVAVTVAKAVAKVVARVAALGSTVAPLAKGFIAAQKAVLVFGRALASMAPAAAFLPGLAGSVGLLVAALKLAGPGIVRALSPITRQFVNADGSTTKLVAEVQRLASQGIKPLASQFVKLNMPTIRTGLDLIALSINSVVKSTGKWLNSINGQSLIQSITWSTVDAMNRLAPKVSAAAIALGNLASRAGDKGILGLSDVIGRLLDKFTKWANDQSVDDIKNSLKVFTDIVSLAKSKLKPLVDFVEWASQNIGKVKAFGNALSGVGLVFGIATGDPFAVIVSGISLLLSNWDKVKSVFTSAVTWWQGIWAQISGNANVQAFAKQIQTSFQQIWTAVQPVITQIAQGLLPKLKAFAATVVNDWIPAATGMIAAMTPVVIWLAKTFGPAFGNTIGNIIDILNGFVRIASGIINLWVGVFTGRWSTALKGVQQIWSGAWQVVLGVFRQIVNAINTVLGAAVSQVKSKALGIKNGILGVFSSAGSWLKSAGSAIINGLVQSIQSEAGQISSALRNAISRAKKALPGPAQAVLSGLGFSVDVGAWAPTQMAAAFSGGGSSFAGTSSGGGQRQQPVQVDLTNNLLLDGRLIGVTTSRIVYEAGKRQSWRDQVGRR